MYLPHFRPAAHVFSEPSAEVKVAHGKIQRLYFLL